MNDLAFLRLPAVRSLVGLPTSTIYRRIANGTFPKPVKIGAHSVAWVRAEIDAWLADCFLQSRGGPVAASEV